MQSVQSATVSNAVALSQILINVNFEFNDESAVFSSEYIAETLIFF